MLQKALRAGMPAVAFLLFASVAIVSTIQATSTRDSLDTLKTNVLGQSVTSNDSSVASSIVGYKLSEFLRGEDVKIELIERINVVNTQLHIGQANFEGIAVDHISMARDSWNETKPNIYLIIEGSRDPQLIDSTFAGLDETRIHSKQAADAWLTDILATNLNDTQHRLEIQQNLFSIFAPIAALAAVIVIVFALRTRQKIELERKNEQLAKISNEKTQFVTQVSHELKTPLTSVIAFTDLLIGKSDVPLSVRQAGHLKVVKRNAEYLRLLVNDLIDVSQLETGQITIEPKPILLNNLMTDLQTTFGPIVERKQQKLIVRETSRALLVNGDHLRLLQVLSNLVGNATKYSKAGSTIVVSSRPFPQYIEINVTDEGEGMPDTDKAHAFEMFYRGTTESSRQESGTGIGLAVSKMIIEAHKGTISIEDAKPAGTQIVVKLPRIKPMSSLGIESLQIA
ncbi:HAMP domain-containing histidine kinase [Dehalococcoides mccartyi]|nr:HAMP domain-containing histidine kinase [Dehalococcoides mccartyi]